MKGMTIKLDILISTISELMPYLVIGMSIIIILLFIMVIVLFKAVGKVETRYRKLMKGTSNNNLEEILLERLNSIEVKGKISYEKVCFSYEDKKVFEDLS